MTLNTLVSPLHPCIVIHHFNVVPLDFWNNEEQWNDSHYYHHVVHCIRLVGFQGTTYFMTLPTVSQHLDTIHEELCYSMY